MIFIAALFVLIAHAAGSGECPDGYLYNAAECSCYYIPASSVKKTWLDAQALCEGEGTNLVSFETQAELDFLKSYLHGIGDDRYYWSSARRVDNEFYWGYDQGDGIISSGWYADEPSDKYGTEDCVESRKGYDFALNDITCTYEQGYICESPEGQTGQTCDKTYGDSCYTVITEPGLTWDDARAACIDMNAHLADYETSSEGDAIKSYLQSTNQPTSFWVGGHRTTFAWGSNVHLLDSNTAWSSSEPNNLGEVEDCLQVYSDHTLNDRNCILYLPIVCEKPASC